MSASVEEFVADLARASGSLHYQTVEAIGDENTPGTAIFALEQLMSLALNRQPRFGVLESANYFTVSNDAGDDALKYFLQVSGGSIGYCGNTVAISSQLLGIKQTLSHTYPTDYIYGMVVGLPWDEVAKSISIWEAVTSASASAGATEVLLSDMTVPNSLGFPLGAYVGNTYIMFSESNSAGTGMIIDPAFFNGVGYGSLASLLASGTKVRFLYEPQIRVLFGMPVESASANPSTFSYYPVTPDSWLPIAKVLIENPGDPVVANSGAAILRTVVDWPVDSMFSNNDIAQITKSCQTLKSQLNSGQRMASLSGLLRSIINYTSSVNTEAQASFAQYWSSRPFRAKNGFVRGVSFDSLERTEFSSSFAKALYSSTSQLPHCTFGLFRGDLYDASQSIVGSSSVTGMSIGSKQAIGLDSSINRGTYVYGVSALLNLGSSLNPEIVETAPAYQAVSCLSNQPAYFFNHLSWSATTDALGYNVYRKSTLLGDQVETRLTQYGEIVSYPAPSTTAPTDTASESMSTDYMAIRFQAAGGGHLGGVGLKMLVNTTLTNPTETLTIQICADDAGAVSDPLTDVNDEDTSSSVSFGTLTTTAQEVVFRHNVTLTAGSYYWIVLRRSAAPTGGTISVRRASPTVTAFHGTSSDGTTWSYADNTRGWFKLYGFIDNGLTSTYPVRRGVKLTGTIAQVAKQLCVYTPNVDTVQTGSKLTANEMIAYVTARNGETGTPVSFVTTIPKGTQRNTRFPLGTASQKFDRIDEFYVIPGSDLAISAAHTVDWSVYDFITVEQMP